MLFSEMHMNKNIHIFQTVNDLSYKSGGPSQTVFNLSKKLEKILNLKIITNNSEGILNINRNSDLKVIESRVKRNIFLTIPSLDSLLRSLEIPQNTIFHDNGIWLPFNNTISQFCFRNNIPSIISTHGMLEPWSMDNKKIKKKIAWFFYQRENLISAKVIHATSEMEAKNILKLNLGVPVAIIPNGVNMPNKDELKKNYNIESIGLKNDGRKIMLFTGRIHPKKGLLNLLKAWLYSSDYLKNWRLVIVGFPEGDYIKELISFSKKNNLDNSVDFLGPLIGKDLINIYRNSDIFVLPTYSENFGLVVAEALSYGLPTLTTQGTPWSILEIENAGWWCKPTIEDLVKNLKTISNLNGIDYLEMSENAFKISKNYNWNDISLSFFDLYQWILGFEKKPAFVIN